MADTSDAVTRPVAVVTGVSRRAGIAAAVARKLACSGWDLAMTGWPAFDETVSRGGDTGVTDMLVSEAKAAGGRAVYLPADLGSVEAIPQIFDRAQETLGPVTALVVVHNYETGAGAGLFDVTPAEFDRSMAVNPRATLFLAAEFARR